MSDIAKFKSGIITVSKDVAMPDGETYLYLWSEEWSFLDRFVSSKNARVLIPIENFVGYVRCSKPKDEDVYVIGEPK